MLRHRTRAILDILEHSIFAPDADVKGMSIESACDLVRSIQSFVPDSLYQLIRRNRDHHRLAIRSGRIQARRELLITMINSRTTVTERAITGEED
jgi:hypothetical protein